MFVKPAKGLVIRDPDLKDLLPDTGREVPESGYWVRRMGDGDVVKARATEASNKNAVEQVKGDN